MGIHKIMKTKHAAWGGHLSSRTEGPGVPSILGQKDWGSFCPRMEGPGSILEEVHLSSDNGIPLVYLIQGDGMHDSNKINSVLPGITMIE